MTTCNEDVVLLGFKKKEKEKCNGENKHTISPSGTLLLILPA